MKQNCFVCEKDISNGTKVLSYHTFADVIKIYDTLKSIDKTDEGKYQDKVNEVFSGFVNGMMCSECAKKDLEVAYKAGQKKELREPDDDVFRRVLDKIKKKKIFGFYLIREKDLTTSLPVKA